MTKLSDIKPHYEKLTDGQILNLTRIDFVEVPAFGSATILYEGETGYSTFGVAIKSTADQILASIQHDPSGRLHEVLRVKVISRLSANKRSYFDLIDADEITSSS